MARVILFGSSPSACPSAIPHLTPDFEAVNLLEVRLYKAAMQAVYGPAPHGCSYTYPIIAEDRSHARILRLSVRDGADQVARAYADRVTPGLSDWTGTGFTSPIRYGPDRSATLPDSDLDDVVIGAILATRPAPNDDPTAHPEATVHANLKAAYPDLAERTAPRNRTVAVDRAFREGVAAIAISLGEHGIAIARIDYDGAGDEGSVAEIDLRDADDQPQKMPEAECVSVSINYRDEIIREIVPLDTALADFATTALECLHCGWEDGEGAWGSLTIDAATATARLTHNARVIASHTTFDAL